jgi:hypothetical protein
MKKARGHHSAKNLPLLSSCLFVLCAVLFPVTRTDDTLLHRLGPGPLLFLGVAVFAAVTTYVSALPNRRVKPSVALLAAISFASIYLISTLLSRDAQFDYAAFHVTIWASAMIVGMNLPTGNSRRLQNFFVVLCTALACYAILEFIGATPSLYQQQASAAGRLGTTVPFLGFGLRSSSSFGHPLTAAAVFSLAGSICAHRIQTSAWWVVPFLFLLPGIAVTGTRSAWLALALGCASTYSGRRITPRTLMMVTATALLALSSIIMTGQDQAILNYFADTASTGSYVHRLGALQSVDDIVGRDAASIAVGSGGASAVALYEQGLLQQTGLRAVDNQYVLWLVEVGLAGQVFFLVLLLSALRLSLQHRSSNLGGLLGAAVMLAFFDGLYWASFAVPLLMLVGMASKHAGETSAMRPTERGLAHTSRCGNARHRR